MPAAITTLRSTLATDLTNAGVWSVFAFPPATQRPPTNQPIKQEVNARSTDPTIDIDTESIEREYPSAGYGTHLKKMYQTPNGVWVAVVRHSTTSD